jgi:uncharacterized membrane protein YhhN
MSCVAEAASLVCACGCAILLVAETRAWPRVRAVAKPFTSLAFVACAVALRCASGERSAFATNVLVGLVAGVIGDVALLGRGRRAFVVGLTAFLAGHVLYVVAATQRAPGVTWLSVWDAAPVVAGVVVLAWLWPHLGSLRVAVVAYVVVIVAMVIAAIAILDVSPRFTIGAVLFFISDVAVARDRFVARSLGNKLWGLPTYYAGQLCIAWSLAA